METLDQQIEEDEAMQEYHYRPVLEEPKTRYDFCKAIATITKRPLGCIFKKTEGYPMDWFYQIQSECKQKKTRESKAKYINWFLKESRPK